MDFLLLQPADTSVNDWFDEDAAPERRQKGNAARAARLEWPPSVRCPGTVARGGRQLMQARADVKNMGQVRSLIAQLGLDWTVIAAQDETTGAAERPVDPAVVLPFLPGSVTEADLRDGTVQLPRYAGHPPWQLSD